MKSRSLGRRHFLIAAASLTLSACGNIIGPPPAPQIYLLQPPSRRRQEGNNAHWSLGIARPDAPDSLSGDRIALAKNDTELDYYANAVWADDIPDLVQTRLLEGFEATKRIDRVAREESGIHADYKLLTEIRDFEAHYERPGDLPVATITIVAYMMRAGSREVIATVTAASTQRCSVNSVDAVAEAFSGALDTAVERIVGWALAPPWA